MVPHNGPWGQCTLGSKLNGREKTVCSNTYCVLGPQLNAELDFWALLSQDAGGSTFVFCWFVSSLPLEFF